MNDKSVFRQLVSDNKRTTFLIALLCMCFIGKCMMNSQNASNPPPPKTDLSQDEARDAAKEFVTRRLKTPATAKFDDYCTACATRSDNNTWIVKTWVDHQNIFGALIRTNYTCVVKYDASTGNAALISLNFDD